MAIKMKLNYKSHEVSAFVILKLLVIVLVLILISTNAMRLNTTVEELQKRDTRPGYEYNVFYGQIPNYLTELGHKFTELRAKEGLFRILWVPLDISTSEVTFVNDIGGSLGVLSEFHNQFFKQNLLTRFEKPGEGDLGSLLAFHGIKYVVVFKSVNYTLGNQIAFITMPNGISGFVGDPLIYIKALDMDPDLTLIEDTDKYLIYQNDAFVPMVFSSYSSPMLDNDSEGTSPTVVHDDDASFWSIDAYGSGNIGMPVLSEELSISIGGTSSLRMVVEAGSYLKWRVYHAYSSSQNWSDKDFVGLWFYGANSGKKLSFAIKSELGNEGYWFIVDDFDGWKRLALPIREPDLELGTLDLAAINLVQIGTEAAEDNVAGTWYLDRTIVVDLGVPVHWVKIAEELYPIYQSDVRPELEILSFRPDSFPSEYLIRVNAEMPSYIVLSQNYHPDWRAYVVDSNGNEPALPHFKALGWANGYYIEKAGTYEIRINFEEQRVKDIIITIWSIFLPSFVAAFVVIGVLRKAAKHPKGNF